jgi:hypothetical protein
LVLVVAALAAAGVVSNTARASVLFGSFEGSQPDNFGSWNGSAVVPFTSDTTGTTYSYSTIGATNGTTSLDLTHSGFAQNLAYDFQANNLVSQFAANDILAFDVTWPTFATSSGFWEIYQVDLNGQGAGFQDVGGTAPIYRKFPPFNQTTGTISINYDSFKSALAANPTYLQMIIATNDGGGAPTDFFFDNFRLISLSNPNWNLPGGGNYNVGTDWDTGSVPNGVDALVNFGSSITAPSTVFSDSNITLGHIVFNNANMYVLAGAGTLTLQTSTGNAIVDVQAGTHKINLPLVIASNTTLNTAATTTLKISDPVTVNSGKSLSQTGTGTVSYESTVTVLSGGSVAFGNSSHAAGLSLAAGANASITAHTTGPLKTLQLDSLTFTDNTSKLDISDNAVIAPGTAATALGLIQNGKLFSSQPANGNLAIGYVTLGSNFEARYTLKGDADLDGSVGVGDLGALATSYNGPGSWANGDFDQSGAVGVGDLGALATNYGQSYSGGTAAADPLAAAAAVPEPAGLVLLMAGAAVGLRPRRRCRPLC